MSKKSITDTVDQARSIIGVLGLNLQDNEGRAIDLVNLAKQHSRWCETECNRELRPSEQVRVKDLERAIKQLGESFPGVKSVCFQGDPRGYTVRLHFYNPKGNTMGGDPEGWGIG